MSIVPKEKYIYESYVWNDAGWGTSIDRMQALYNSSGFPDMIVLRGGDWHIENIYILWDTELVNGWSAGTVQIRVYNQGTEIYDSGALSNTLTKNASFADPFTNNSAVSRLGGNIQLQNDYNVIQVRVTTNASFPAIDSESGIQIRFKKLIK